MEFLLFLPLALATVAFLLYLVAWWRKQEVIRYNLRTRFKYDPRGNSEHFFDAVTEQQYLAPPGNTQFADPIYFINGLALDKPQKQHKAVIQKGKVIDSEFVVETGEETYSVKPGEKVESEAKLLKSGEMSLEEIATFLTNCKREEIGKVSALGKLGIKPGKSKEYITWGNFFDNIEVR